MHSSDSLFHFTGSLANLQGILTEGFRVSPSLEPFEILGRAMEATRPDAPAAIPMVCFCDIRLSQTTEHVATYGAYAIGLSKRWGIARNIAPVMYGHESSPLVHAIRAYSRLVRALKIPEDPRDEIRRLALETGRLVYFFKLHEGTTSEGQRRRFYDEQEWRYVPEHIEDIPDFPEKLLASFYKAAGRANGRSFLASYCAPLTFGPDDVTHVIVSDESEIPAVVAAVEKSPLLRGADWQLFSRITTVARIRSDF